MIRMILGKRLILSTRRIGGLANNLTVGQLYCRITTPPENSARTVRTNSFTTIESP
jgi:hypothetical protein